MTTKRALLVAVKSNEPSMIDSHISCHRFEKCIIEHCGFLPQNICKIVDNKHSNPDETSSGAILQQLTSFDLLTKSGDILLFYFSGHGYLEKDGYPALLMSDNIGITGERLQMLVASFNKRRAVFTVIADCCYSGGLLRKAYEQIGHSVVNRRMDRQGILLSACQQHQVALGSVEFGTIFTKYLIQFIAEAKGRITYWDLIMKVKLELRKIGALQMPGLYCTDEEAKTQIFEHV